MAARVCVGGAGAGAEPTPPTLTHSAPQPGRSARCLFFCSAPTTPGSPPPTPRVSPTITAAPILRGPPPPTPGSSAQTRRPVPPRPSRRLPGIQWSGGKTRPNVPRGEGRGDPPSPGPGASSPRPAPRLSGKRRAMGQRMVASLSEPASLHLPLSPVPCAPSSHPSWGCREETGPPAGWEGMDAEGGHWVSPSPPPLNNERS